MKKLLLFVLLIVGCVFAQADIEDDIHSALINLPYFINHQNNIKDSLESSNMNIVIRVNTDRRNYKRLNNLIDLSKNDSKAIAKLVNSIGIIINNPKLVTKLTVIIIKYSLVLFKTHINVVAGIETVYAITPNVIMLNGIIASLYLPSNKYVIIDVANTTERNTIGT